LKVNAFDATVLLHKRHKLFSEAFEDGRRPKELPKHPRGQLAQILELELK
jgi:hypothetical protein